MTIRTFCDKEYERELKENSEDWSTIIRKYKRQYKDYREHKRFEKRYKKIHSGKYDHHSWKYYAQRNGFYPEDERVD